MGRKYPPMARDQKDYFYRKAKSEGYRARSAFKLQQINKRFRLIRRGDAVLDLGAAPGGWLQVAKEISGGTVVGVDLLAIEPIDGVSTIKADITAQKTLELIADALGGKADVVICDAAPNLSGNWTLDHARSIDLSRSALRVAGEVLRPGGNFLVKVFQGDTFLDFLSEVRESFRRAQAHSPAASRKESAEMYVVAQGFFLPPVSVGEVLELHIVGVGKSGDGVAEVEGFKIFVPGAAVGERARVRIGSIRSGHAVGTIEPPLD